MSTETILQSTSRWRDLSAERKVLLATRAVLTAAPVPLAFSLNLSPVVAQRVGSDYIRRRLIRHLEYALGRSVAVLLVFQWTAGQARAHLHGAIAAREGEIEPIKAALTKAAGRWESPRGKSHQLHLQPLRNEHWAGYIARDLCCMQNNRNHVWSVSNPLRRAAKELVRQNSKKLFRRHELAKAEKINNHAGFLASGPSPP
jgi:hypothetical protein